MMKSFFTVQELNWKYNYEDVCKSDEICLDKPWASCYLLYECGNIQQLNINDYNCEEENAADSVFG